MTNVFYRFLTLLFFHTQLYLFPFAMLCSIDIYVIQINFSLGKYIIG